MWFWMVTAACFGVRPFPQTYPVNPFPNYPGYPVIISGGPAPPIFFPSSPGPSPAPVTNATVAPGNVTTLAPTTAVTTTTTTSSNATTTAPTTTTTARPNTTITAAPTTTNTAITTTNTATTTTATTTTPTTTRTTLPTLTPVPSSPPPTTGITTPANVTPTQQTIPTGPPIDPRTVTLPTPRSRFGEENSFEPVRFPDSDDIVIDVRGDETDENYPRDRRQILPCGCYVAAQCNATQNANGVGLIDFRIVTSAITGGAGSCINGMQYCCPSIVAPQITCGNRIPSTASYPTQPGQARYGEYPWMVVIMDLGNAYVGGGVLLDSKNVLTSAHKVVRFPNGNGLKVRLGEWDTAGNYEQYPYKDFSIMTIWAHEAFNPSTLQNDIALIRLAGTASVGVNYGIIPICLPAAGQSFEGKRCWVSGWGKDNYGINGRFQTIIKTVDVPILSQVACETQLRNTRLGQAYVLDRTSFVCAGGEPSKDACTGDGGSGLVCETSPGRWTLAGLVAWGLGCASQGVPAAYVNIPNYVSWIQERLGIP